MCKIIIIFYLHIYVHKVNNGRLGSRLLTSAFRSCFLPPQLELDLLSFVLKKEYQMSVLSNLQASYLFRVLSIRGCAEILSNHSVGLKLGWFAVTVLTLPHCCAFSITIQHTVDTRWAQTLLEQLYLWFKSQANSYNTSKPINAYQNISIHINTYQNMSHGNTTL